MSIPVDLVSLRDAFQAALGDQLGTYTFPDPNSPTAPAITIDYGNNTSVPKGTDVAGLECVIVFRPEVPLEPMLAGTFKETYSVNVLLKQWDVEADTIEALNRVLNALILLTDWGLKTGSIVRQLPLPAMNNIETVTLTLMQILLRA